MPDVPSLYTSMYLQASMPEVKSHLCTDGLLICLVFCFHIFCVAKVILLVPPLFSEEYFEPVPVFIALDGAITCAHSRQLAVPPTAPRTWERSERHTLIFLSNKPTYRLHPWACPPPVALRWDTPPPHTGLLSVLSSSSKFPVGVEPLLPSCLSVPGLT